MTVDILYHDFSLLDVSTGHTVIPLQKTECMASSVTGTGDTGAVTVFVTVPTEKVGEEIAGLLVNPEARLAACVNILPGSCQQQHACGACILLHGRVLRNATVNNQDNHRLDEYKTTTAKTCLCCLLQW